MRTEKTETRSTHLICMPFVQWHISFRSSRLLRAFAHMK